jgi:hypothetical protein
MNGVTSVKCTLCGQHHWPHVACDPKHTNPADPIKPLDMAELLALVVKVAIAYDPMKIDKNREEAWQMLQRHKASAEWALKNRR